jgi:hypothetical protein
VEDAVQLWIRPSCTASLPPQPGFLVRATRNDFQRIVRQWALRCLRLIPRCAHPDVALLDWLDDAIRCRRQKAVDQVRAGDRLGLGATVAFELSPDAAKGCQRPTIVESEPDDVRFLSLGVRLGSVFGKAVLAGTRQRFSGLSQPRQCGDDVLRMLVTGGPPVLGGAGCPSASKPVRARNRYSALLVSDSPETRPASTVGYRHTGSWTQKRAMMAAWFVVMPHDAAALLIDS